MSEKFEINLFVKRLHPNAVIPTYAHPSDAGSTSPPLPEPTTTTETSSTELASPSKSHLAV